MKYMSNVVKFNFEKDISKSIEINGELYVLPMDDDSKERYMIATQKFGQLAQEIKEQGSNLVELSPDEIKEITVKQRELFKAIIEDTLGEGKFEVVYNLAGRSAIKLLPLVQEIMRLISDLDKESFESELNKYLQNGKK